MSTLTGYNIIIYDKPIGLKQHRVPKSKRFRIRKKWAKRPENFKPVFLTTPLINAASCQIICTSQMADKLKHHCTP